eukprot:gnl/TRDRNA2_/TRDRNA2_38062_c0_seq1.p1 gnl/TRDRNA2_/TRDRNA2_38062_c0~~gnl/TRDRNA2_/TRDRNA2_38062_c0_seq1.p1  ORF type:complete len:915 (-),score=236.95 gnl/TRDRNA2_/TRDRNA2_38062_c0_seq1:101-2626(-)
MAEEKRAAFADDAEHTSDKTRPFFIKTVLNDFLQGTKKYTDKKTAPTTVSVTVSQPQPPAAVPRADTAIQAVILDTANLAENNAKVDQMEEEDLKGTGTLPPVASPTAPILKSEPPRLPGYENIVDDFMKKSSTHHTNFAASMADLGNFALSTAVKAPAYVGALATHTAAVGTQAAAQALLSDQGGAAASSSTPATVADATSAIVVQMITTPLPPTASPLASGGGGLYGKMMEGFSNIQRKLFDTSANWASGADEAISRRLDGVARGVKVASVVKQRAVDAATGGGSRGLQALKAAKDTGVEVAAVARNGMQRAGKVFLDNFLPVTEVTDIGQQEAEGEKEIQDHDLLEASKSVSGSEEKYSAAQRIAQSQREQVKIQANEQKKQNQARFETAISTSDAQMQHQLESQASAQKTAEQEINDRAEAQHASVEEGRKLSIEFVDKKAKAAHLEILRKVAEQRTANKQQHAEQRRSIVVQAAKEVMENQKKENQANEFLQHTVSEVMQKLTDQITEAFRQNRDMKAEEQRRLSVTKAELAKLEEDHKATSDEAAALQKDQMVVTNNAVQFTPGSQPLTDDSLMPRSQLGTAQQVASAIAGAQVQLPELKQDTVTFQSSISHPDDGRKAREWLSELDRQKLQEVEDANAELQKKMLSMEDKSNLSQQDTDAMKKEVQDAMKKLTDKMEALKRHGGEALNRVMRGEEAFKREVMHGEEAFKSAVKHGEELGKKVITKTTIKITKHKADENGGGEEDDKDTGGEEEGEVEGEGGEGDNKQKTKKEKPDKEDEEQQQEEEGEGGHGGDGDTKKKTQKKKPHKGDKGEQGGGKANAGRGGQDELDFGHL